MNEKTVLRVFDFDGTLFDSPPDTPENRSRYENHAGLPWLIDDETARRLTKEKGFRVGPRRGWWGRWETLSPPLVPDPAPLSWFFKPVCDLLLASKQDPEAATVVLTGRHKKLKPLVVRILAQGNLLDAEADERCSVHCLGERFGDGQPPSETFPWKRYALEHLTAGMKSLKKVEIWEDRGEHVELFRKLTLPAETLVVHHANAADDRDVTRGDAN